MRMTAAQIDHVNFAVGAAKINDPTQAQTTLTAIKAALLRNLSGQLIHEKNTVTSTDGKITLTNDFEAIGRPTNPTRSSTRMIGKLIAREGWVFQVLVVGPEAEINKDAVETFLTSFKTTE